MSEDESSFTNKLSTPLLGLLTLLLTIIASIPSFLSLNDKEAIVYYSVSTSHVSIPSTLDEKLALTALESAGIPGSTIELTIINQGNTEAKSVKFEIETENELLATWSEPSESSKPIWVNLPNLNITSNKKQLQAEITQLATTKPIHIYVGYKYTPKEEPKVTVFSTGQPANLVDDISSIEKWSKWNVFRLPAYVFLAGVGFIVLWSLIVALAQNPSFRNALIDALIDATHIGYAPSAVAKLITEALENEKNKKP